MSALNVAAIQTLSLLATLTTLKISAQLLSLPAAEYHHEIIYSEDALLGHSADIPEILPLSSSAGLPADVGFQPAGNLFHTPVLHSVNLFTPNTVQQPAETPGQIENYRKALEEEAREAERAENAITTVFTAKTGGFISGRPRNDVPRSYVSVKVGEGAKGYDYGYSV